EGASMEQLMAIKCAAREVIDDPSISHTTFELEFEGEACPMRDTECGAECAPEVAAREGVHT
ncbi:MAG: hypothetical protein ACYCYF_07590, partial [Anaerolineae bacterium]